jgi:glutaminyl-tRNA synthetase
VSDRLVFHRIVALKDTWERRNLGAAEQRDSSSRDIGTSGHRDIGASGRRDIGTSGHRDPWEGVTAEQREAMERLVRAHGIEAADARVLAESPERLVLFEEAVEVHPANPQGIANWIVNELLGLLGGDAGFDSLQLGGEHLGELVSLIDRGVVSTKIAKEVLAEMTASGRSPVEIVQTRGLVQISDHDALAAIADEILAAHPEELAAYRAGKTQLLGFFMGRLMQATEGKANPEVGREVLQERLGRQINPPSPEPM